MMFSRSGITWLSLCRENDGPESILTVHQAWLPDSKGRSATFLPWNLGPGDSGRGFMVVTWPPQRVDGFLAAILLLSSAVCTTPVPEGPTDTLIKVS